jgi:cytochrome c oxidase subunit 1/cytochrome c oxidase subunit I+III
MFVWNVVKSYRNGVIAGDNPWDAPTLEWATSSPPPPYNFPVIPTVASRHPLWEGRLGEKESPHRSSVRAGLVLQHGKEALGTSPLDAEPNIILKMPHDTIVPLLLSLAMTGVAIGLALLNWWVVVAAGACVGICVIIWLWPRESLGETVVPATGTTSDV